MFLGFVATDDASASLSYAREIDTEEEIKQMEKDTQELIKNTQNLKTQGPSTHLDLDEVDEELFLDDDDDLDPEELDRLQGELEANLNVAEN